MSYFFCIPILKTVLNFQVPKLCITIQQIELEHGEDHIICKERHTQFICTEVYFKMGIVQPYLNGLCLTFSKFQSEFLRVQGNFLNNFN